MVLAVGHPLRTQKALGRPDALAGFLEVDHRLFEDGIFVGHARSIRIGASSDYPIVSPSPVITRLSVVEEEQVEVGSLEFRHNNRENPYMFRDAMLKLLLAETLPYAKLITDR